MIEYIRTIPYMLTHKRIDEEKLDIVRIKILKKDVSYFNLSTNKIASFFYDGALYYFRECPKILSKKEYFTLAVTDFFNSLTQLGINEKHFKQEYPIRIEFSDEEIEAFRYYMSENMQSNKFISCLSQTDIHANKSGFSIWDNKISLDRAFFEGFGLYHIEKELSDIAVYFLWCMRAVAKNYRTLKIAKGNNYSFFYSVRAISSEIVAKALDLGHMITASVWCLIEYEDGKTQFGLLSQAAPGTRMKDTVVSCSGGLQRELVNLNLLDLISYQPDHGPNNYNVEIGDDCRVVAFDNDNAKTFFPNIKVTAPLAGCRPLINKKGFIDRPYFDRNVFEKLVELDVKALNNDLKLYLNVLQRIALLIRIIKVKRSISKTKSVNNCFLCDASDWSIQTAKEEISGIYGKTYLMRAIND
ncbi:MAG: hypothetical protein ACI3XI_06370 [Eubacteriales bacterium]